MAAQTSPGTNPSIGEIAKRQHPPVEKLWIQGLIGAAESAKLRANRVLVRRKGCGPGLAGRRW
jgi:hypothetical protein